MDLLLAMLIFLGLTGVFALLGCLRLESIVNFSEVRPAQPLASLFELGLLVLVCELALRAPLRLSRLGQMLGGLLLGVLCLRFEDWLALGQGLVTGQTWARHYNIRCRSQLAGCTLLRA